MPRVVEQLREADFKTWLSITWADIVHHPDPEQHRKHRAAGTGVDYAEGIRLTDPRRMAVYFAKYGSAGAKNYQHTVPAEWLTSVLVCQGCGTEYDEDRDECPACGCPEAEVVDTGGGPGRFWGYRGLRPVLAIRQVLPEVGIQAGRILRRWYAAKRLTKQVSAQRVEQATGRVYYRRSRKRKRLFSHNRGFVTVNDGPALAAQLARHLTGTPADDRKQRSPGSLPAGRPYPPGSGPIPGNRSDQHGDNPARPIRGHDGFP